MNRQRINSERANSQLLSPTHMLLLLYKWTAEGWKKSRVHLATQTLVLTIELPVWNWWQTADGQKLESETDQEVNEEKNYSSSPLPPLLRRRERDGGGWGMRKHEGGKSRSQRILGNTGHQLLFMLMLSWLFGVNLYMGRKWSCPQHYLGFIWQCWSSNIFKKTKRYRLFYYILWDNILIFYISFLFSFWEPVKSSL